MGRLLLDSVRASPVVRFGDYDYFVHPLADGIPAIEPALVAEVVDEILAVTEVTRSTPRTPDRIVTAEAMGIPVGMALSLRTAIPLTIVRKRAYGLAGEKQLAQKTGYGGASLFVNGLRKGHRVLVVDDVVSTGGTLAALLEGLRGLDVEVADIVAVFEKGEGRRLVEERFGVTVKTLCRVEVKDGRATPVGVLRPRP